MAGLEETINSVLSSPEQMEKLSLMAKSLMGSGVLGNLQTEAASPTPPPAPEPPPPPAQQAAMPDLSSILGSIDPNMISGIMSAMNQDKGADQTGDTGLGSMLGGIDPKMLASIGGILAKSGTASSKQPLLEAMMPYMSPERREKLKRAMQLAKLARVAGLAFGTLGGGKDV